MGLPSLLRIPYALQKLPLPELSCTNAALQPPPPNQGTACQTPEDSRLLWLTAVGPPCTESILALLRPAPEPTRAEMCTVFLPTRL